MDQEGQLWISMKFSDDDQIKIIIEDNGYKSVDLSKLNDMLLDGVHTDEGFGIKNVNKRIRLHFGNSYGLSYEMRAEGGTRAIITIPATKEES
jgi:two-component system sensor histidine kinase YesM